MKNHTVIKRSYQEKAMHDVALLGQHKPFMFAHYKFDITKLRATLKAEKKKQPTPISVALIKLISNTVSDYPQLNVITTSNKAVLFDDIDVLMPIATKDKNVHGFVLRKVNTKNATQLSNEITQHQNLPFFKFDKSQKMFLSLPRWLRAVYYNLLKKQPLQYKKVFGSIFVSFIYANHEYAYAQPPHNLGFYFGAPDKNNKIGVTICLSHDVADGQKASGVFAKALQNRIESFTMDMLK